MRTDRDDRADGLAQKIWELLEQRAAELRRWVSMKVMSAACGMTP